MGWLWWQYAHHLLLGRVGQASRCPHPLAYHQHRMNGVCANGVKNLSRKTCLDSQPPPHQNQPRTSDCCLQGCTGWIPPMHQLWLTLATTGRSHTMTHPPAAPSLQSREVTTLGWRWPTTAHRPSAYTAHARLPCHTQRTQVHAFKHHS